MDLCQGNTNLFKEIVPKITQVSPNAILIVITNPVDIMVYTTLQLSKIPTSRVIGTGTMIDSSRFRALLAAKTKVNPADIHAYIIGEHGESQLPVLSRADMRSISIQERSTAETAKNVVSCVSIFLFYWDVAYFNLLAKQCTVRLSLPK